MNSASVTKTLRSLSNKITGNLSNKLSSKVSSKLSSSSIGRASSKMPDLTSGNWMTHLAVIIAVVLALWYVMKRQYQATVFLVLISLTTYFLTNNLMYGAIIGIIITVILYMMRFFNRSEGFKEGKANIANAAIAAKTQKAAVPAKKV